jgi:hypothetical protein
VTESAAVAVEQHVRTRLLDRRLLAAILIGTIALGIAFGVSQLRSGPRSGESPKANASRAHRLQPVLVPDRRPLARLPVPIQRAAVTILTGRLIVLGGLNGQGVSTDTVTAVPLTGGRARQLATLPDPVHDAAVAVAGRTVTMFGGGEIEGTTAIVQVAPGDARNVGTLPQPLSDAGAAEIGSSDYVAGGWDGSTLNMSIYRYVPGRSPKVVGRLQQGVRYPAIAALDGKLLIAGGETADGVATATISAFDPATGKSSRLGRLPYSVSHAAGAVLGGRFYVLGGQRAGSPIATILSWSPGRRRARRAGRLVEPLSDLAAASTSAAIVVAGGEALSGPARAVSVLRPAGAG